MLKEIKCEQFAQKTIYLHNGLNVISGDENASNSIGKSSALLVIDFAFGGFTYARQDDILTNVGHHDIFFCHVFNGIGYYFKRNTSTPNTIYVCNDQYEVIEEYSIEKFYSFLLRNYKISHNSLSFRDYVSLFSRIYGKENLNEKKPLDLITGEAGNKSIICVLKIFDKFDDVEEQKLVKEETARRLKTFKSAQGMKLVSQTLSKKDRIEKEREIEICNTGIESITSQLSSMSVNLSNQQLEAISIQKQQQHILETLLSKQKYKLYRLERSLNLSKEKCVVDTTQLSIYFPTINIKEVDKINDFHERLIGILKTKIISEIKTCKNLISDYNIQMEHLNKDIESILNSKNAVSLAVDNLIKLKTQKDKLIKNIEDSDKYNQYNQDKKTAAENFSVMIHKVLTDIQQQLNNELSALSESVSPRKNSPQFALHESSYDFFIPNDTGAGSKYKSTILTDLSFLHLTDLPFVIHDTILFKNIEDDTIDNIIMSYASFKSKQVFIAFDHINSFSKRTVDILKKCTVLNIAPGGMELYGKSWNIQTNNK